ncbi:MAG: hypothetical protein AAF530_00190 [Pseudomonadota bacterium]
MSEDSHGASPTLALSTKVEEEFISPLTSIRGSLEILRDFPNLARDERQRFVETALRGCAKLEQGVADLTNAVYAASQSPAAAAVPNLAPQVSGNEYTKRIQSIDDLDVMEIDFSDFVFRSTMIVNEFFDAIDRAIKASGRSWYFVIDFQNCSIWPEAWVAFAHRGKRLNRGLSLGTVRYVEQASSDEMPSRLPGVSSQDEDLFDSREAALARIEEIKKTNHKRRAP